MRENKITRKIFTLLCVLTLIVGLGILNIPVCAEEIPQDRQLPRLVDDADLLTDSEEQELNTELDEISEKQQCDVVVVTKNSLDGKSAQDYADDFFDAIAENGDGVALLIDMQNREICISTGGIAIRYLTDARVEDILNDGYEPISDGEYEQCLSVMLKDVLVYYDEGIPSNQYEYEETDIEITPAEYVITSVALALIPGAIVFLVLVLFCKLRNGKYKYDAHESGTVNIKKHSDVLVNTVVTHRHIEEKKAEDSGRSTVHTSSSGVKHGGGSKKF